MQQGISRQYVTLTKQFNYPRVVATRRQPTITNNIVYKNLEYGEKLLEGYFERKKLASSTPAQLPYNPSNQEIEPSYQFDDIVSEADAVHEVEHANWNKQIDPYIREARGEPSPVLKKHDTEPLIIRKKIPDDIAEKAKRDYFANPTKHIQSSLKYLGFYGPEYDLLPNKAKMAIIEEHLGKRDKIKLLKKELQQESFKLNKLTIEFEGMKAGDKLTRLSTRRKIMIAQNVEKAVKAVIYERGSELSALFADLSIQITKVDISNSYRKVFVGYYQNGTLPQSELNERLDAVKPSIRILVQEKIDMKYAPEIEFVVDKSIVRKNELDIRFGTILEKDDAEKNIDRLYELASLKDATYKST